MMVHLTPDQQIIGSLIEGYLFKGTPRLLGDTPKQGILNPGLTLMLRWLVGHCMLLVFGLPADTVVHGWPIVVVG